MTVNTNGLLLVLLLGSVNWIATEIIVTSVIFKDVREIIDRCGERVKARYPRIGEKICYFLTCALCVGVWIGFMEALAFGGPLQPLGWASWAAFIANGLAYKAIGHLLLQLNAWFHNRVELMKWQAQAAKIEATERRELSDLGHQGSNTITREQVCA
jgi:hypothetical protein